MVDKLEAGERWQHVKRGTFYHIIGCAELQTVTCDLPDGADLVVYRGEDGKLWAREAGEFTDGRFVPVAATPANGEQVERVRAAIAAFQAAHWDDCYPQACVLRDLLAATLSTPTEDTRARVKVLEEALERLEAACDALAATRSRETYLRMVDVDQATDQLQALDDARRDARTALGNKETDRHG